MDPLERIDELERRFEEIEPSVRSFLPEERRFERLRRDAAALCDRYPQAAGRPPLFGLLVGVKDIFHVAGWPTQAGSRLPAAVLAGDEAESVSRLTAAGALIVGRTVTTEFAHFAPGPTRNPRNIAHTPGGSSSGSAAAVAAGLCDLALGSQTIGSIIRPAAFCGVVGLKPSYGRISARGVIPLSWSLDHVGCLAPDVETAERAARVLYTTWTDAGRPRTPVFGIPAGPYLERLPAGTAGWFETVARAIEDAGYELRRVPMLEDFEAVCGRHHLVVAAEAARVHAAWFADHASLYDARTAALIRRGQAVTDRELETARAELGVFRRSMQDATTRAGVDAWLAPSALGPAPRGLESTGDPIMNLPWTQAGFPVVGLPAGADPGGLPLGLQIAGNVGTDEALLTHANALQRVTSRL